MHMCVHVCGAGVAMRRCKCAVQHIPRAKVTVVQRCLPAPPRPHAPSLPERAPRSSTYTPHTSAAGAHATAPALGAAADASHHRHCWWHCSRSTTLTHAAATSPPPLSPPLKDAILHRLSQSQPQCVCTCVHYNVFRVCTCKRIGITASAAAADAAATQHAWLLQNTCRRQRWRLHLQHCTQSCTNTHSGNHGASAAPARQRCCTNACAVVGATRALDGACTPGMAIHHNVGACEWEIGGLQPATADHHAWPWQQGGCTWC
jgi:hypothetical protein